MAIVFDDNTDYAAVERECYDMLSVLQSKNCGCCKSTPRDLLRASALLNSANWERTNRPSQYVKTIRTVYFLLLSLSR